MSTDIHGFEPSTFNTGNPDDATTTGVLVFRLDKPTSAADIEKLNATLADSGIVSRSSMTHEARTSSESTLAAFSWNVPGPTESDNQREILAGTQGVAEIWAVTQQAEADLDDWFAPQWRIAPPHAKETSFELGVSPEDVSWEGFGISLTFGRAITHDERKVAATLAGLWLTAYSDRNSPSALGGRCYRRPVIAPRGDSGMVIGLEGFANPGSGEEATGHILWLADKISAVLPVESAQFVSLLPQPGDEAMAMAQPSSATATREWVNLDVDAELGLADPAEAELAASDDAAGSHDGADDDEWEVAQTQHIVRADEKIAEALAKRDAVAAVDQPSSADGSEDAVAAHSSKAAGKLPAETNDSQDALHAAGGRNGVPRESRETLEVTLDTSMDVDGEATHRAPVGRREEEAPSARTDATDDSDLPELVSDDIPATEISADAPGASTPVAAALEAGDLDAAIAAFDQLGDKSEAALILQATAEQLDPSDWDDIQVILQLAPRLIECELETPSPQLMLIAALCRIGRGNEAIELGLRDLDKPMVLFETYERLCVFRRPQEAADLIGRLAEQGHDGVGDHYYNLGCSLRDGHPEIAVALFKGAIACGSPSPQAEINLGITLLSAGESEAAREVSKAALSSHGSEPNLWANLIDAQTRLGDESVDESIERAEAVINNCGEVHEAPTPAACTVGCAALITDITDALVLQGKAERAIELIERHTTGNPEMVHSLLAAKAIALCHVGRGNDAAELLENHVSTDDANSASYYRARAAHAHASEQTDQAIGFAAAALLADPQIADKLMRDSVGDILRTVEGGFALASDGTPPRPSSVPAEARWVVADKEWELGNLTDDGKKDGPFRYFRADGSMCNECQMLAGGPHGEFLRFHESGEISQKGSFHEGQLHGTRTWIASTKTTSEKMHGPQIAESIRRSEMDYVGGRVIAVRHYNADGVLCAPDGEAYPDRPGDVAANAFFRDDTWIAGEVDDEGKRRGTWKTWTDEGVLVEESNYEAGELHGEYKAFFADGSLSAEGQYEDGSKTGTFVYQRRGDVEHDDFPIAAGSIAVAEESHDTMVPGVRLYDKSGREATIDGTPLEEWTSDHPQLDSWWNELWQVPWPELEDASENAHRVPHLLLGLLATDENIAQFAFKALSWHLNKDGEIYPATATSLPFMIRLCQYEKTPNLVHLCNFIRNMAVFGPDQLTEAAEAGAHAVTSTHEALNNRTDIFFALLNHTDPQVRAAAGAILGGCHQRADQMSSHLSGSLGTEDDDMVRASHMFSLARLETPEALFVVEAQVDGASKLVGASAAMALVMARGPQAGDRVANRLIQALVDYDDAVGEAYLQSPWSDDDLVTEIAQAYGYTLSESDDAVDRLVEAFAKVETADGVATVAAAIMVAAESGDGLNPDICKVLVGIADCDSLWQLGDAVVELLSGYDLPTDPNELRDLANS